MKLKPILTATLMLFFIIGTAKAGIFSGYDIKIKFLEKEDSLAISSKITISDYHDESITALFYDSAVIKKIEVLGEHGNTIIDYTRGGDAIKLSIPSKLSKNGDIVLNIDYAIAKNSFFIADLKDACYLVRTMRWCPFQYNTLAKYKVEVELPSDMMCIMPGDMKEITKAGMKTVTSEMYCEPSFNVTIAKNGFYRVLTRQIGDSRVEYYEHFPNEKSANFVLDEFSKTYEFCSENIGGRNSETVRIVELPDTTNACMMATTFDGSISACCSLIRESSDPESGFWISHETSHLWMGAGIYVDMKGELRNFVEEGFNEYIRLCYIEQIYGVDSLNATMKSYEDKYRKYFIGKEYDTSIDDPRASSANYMNAPLLFMKALQPLGLENRKKLLQELFSKYRRRIIGKIELFDLISKYDKSGRAIELINRMVKLKGEDFYKELHKI